MKQANKLLAIALLTLCCGFIHSSLLADPPPYPPPLKNENECVAMMMQTTSEINLVFVSNVADAQVEVYDNNGKCIRKERGRASAYSRLRFDARNWKGRHTIVVRADKQVSCFEVDSSK